MKEFKLKRIILYTIFFVLIDQVIKVLLYNNFKYDYHYTITEFLALHLQFNTYGNFLSARFRIEYNAYYMAFIYIISLPLTVLLIYCLKYFVLFLKLSPKFNYFNILAISGLVSSLLDKLFWGYTLDYIEISYIGIFDLKDCYLFVGLIGITIFFILTEINAKKIKLKVISKEIFEFIKMDMQSKI